MKIDYQPGFLERDDIVHADTFYGTLKRGAVVEAYDGSVWTTVASGLTGYGVIEGDDPDIASTPDSKLPIPTAMLREPYSSLKERPLGEYVALVRQGSPETVPETDAPE